MMGCSKDSGYPGFKQKKGAEFYNRPAHSEYKPTHLPNPIEVVCIRAEKVYEFCKSEETSEVITDLHGIACGPLEDVNCLDAELVIDKKHPFICKKIPNTLRAKISFWYRFRFAYIDQAGYKYFTSDPIYFEKTVILSDRIFDKRLFVQCEVFLDCPDCFISGPQEVTCCVYKLLLVRLVALVQLAVPAYGFCEEPADCQEGGCPQYTPPWPPFPPQPCPPPSAEVPSDEGNGEED